MSEFKVNTITDRTGSHGPQVCGITTFGSSGMQLPSGPTDFRGGRGRGVFAGGYNPGGNNTIEFIEIATTGNATDFGDMKKNSANAAAFGSSTKGIFCGGYFAPSANTDTIQFVTFSSRGGANEFGDLTVARHYHGSTSSPTRGVWWGGMTPTKLNTIDYVQIMSTGDAVDFGDSTITANASMAGLSNGHGGL